MIKYSSIKYAFLDDEDISKYCDPDYKDKNIKELVFNIYSKILEYQELGEGKFDDLKIDGELIGYVFYWRNLLVSFGINKKHREKNKLKKVFEIIKNNFNSDFETYMWERNKRAINWLKKCGMIEVDSKIDKVIKLKYILCQ